MTKRGSAPFQDTVLLLTLSEGSGQFPAWRLGPPSLEPPAPAHVLGLRLSRRHLWQGPSLADPAHALEPPTPAPAPVPALSNTANAAAPPPVEHPVRTEIDQELQHPALAAAPAVAAAPERAAHRSMEPQVEDVGAEVPRYGSVDMDLPPNNVEVVPGQVCLPSRHLLYAPAPGPHDASSCPARHALW